MHQETEKLRIACYNILNGGEERIELIFKTIKEINPDICGILEATGWQDNISYFKKTAQDLGYRFFEIATANSKYNIAVFSKISIVVKIIKKEIRHVILEAIIESGPFKNLNIFFIHLSPKSEDERLLETEKLIEQIKKLSEVVIIGDFNSLSPYDPYDYQKLLKKFKESGVEKYGTEVLRFDVIKKFELSGLIDGFNSLKHSFSSTTPTPSNIDRNHPVDIRIDYAFFKENTLKYLRKCEIFKNEITDKASDHYPIFIDLQK